jgi:hypothetical protein
MKGMVQSAESLSKHYWISSKALMPIVRSEQGPALVAASLGPAGIKPTEAKRSSIAAV